MLCRGLRAAKILSQHGQAERSRRTQCPGERLAPPRKVQTRRVGVQIHTPAREPGLRVRLDNVPHRHEAKQAGLNRTLLAAYTSTHYRHTRRTPLGSRSHSSRKSTVSERPEHQARTVWTGQASLVRRGKLTGLKILLRPEGFPGFPGRPRLPGLQGSLGPLCPLWLLCLLWLLGLPGLVRPPWLMGRLSRLGAGRPLGHLPGRPSRA